MSSDPVQASICAITHVIAAFVCAKKAAEEGPPSKAKNVAKNRARTTVYEVFKKMTGQQLQDREFWQMVTAYMTGNWLAKSQTLKGMLVSASNPTVDIIEVEAEAKAKAKAEAEAEVEVEANADADKTGKDDAWFIQCKGLIDAYKANPRQKEKDAVYEFYEDGAGVVLDPFLFQLMLANWKKAVQEIQEMFAAFEEFDSNVDSDTTHADADIEYEDDEDIEYEDDEEKEQFKGKTPAGMKWKPVR